MTFRRDGNDFIVTFYPEDIVVSRLSPVITSSRRTVVTSGSSLWSSVDTSRSPTREISIADDGLSLSAAEWLMPTVS